MACAAPQQSEGPGTAGLRGSTTPPDRRVGRPVATYSAVPFAFSFPLTVIATGRSGATVVAFLRLLGGNRNVNSMVINRESDQVVGTDL